jgi:hypothetical protein
MTKSFCSQYFYVPANEILKILATINTVQLVRGHFQTDQHKYTSVIENKVIYLIPANNSAVGFLVFEETTTY